MRKTPQITNLITCVCLKTPFLPQIHWLIMVWHHVTSENDNIWGYTVYLYTVKVHLQIWSRYEDDLPVWSQVFWSPHAIVIQLVHDLHANLLQLGDILTPWGNMAGSPILRQKQIVINYQYVQNKLQTSMNGCCSPSRIINTINISWAKTVSVVISITCCDVTKKNILSTLPNR